MANEEHVKILKQGVKVWNEFRLNNPMVKPDLKNANLEKIILWDENYDGIKLDNVKKIEGIDPDLKGIILADANLEGANFSSANLTNAIFFNANLKDVMFKKTILNGSFFESANLEGANLQNAELKEADLFDSSLKNAVLDNANLKNASLMGVDFEGALLLKTNLNYANLENANLDNAFILSANFKKADIRNASFNNAWLRRSNLKGANLIGVNLEGADVTFVKYNRRGKYSGIRVATCHGSPLFKRFAQDQAFIEEFRSKWWRFPIYLLWLILADCGRSILLWSAWSILFAVLFGLKFFSLGYSAFMHNSYLPWTKAAAIYYSVVTFTTLGFGDVVPNTQEAAWWVMAEVITGYVMLGGLISIFATKLARRS